MKITISRLKWIFISIGSLLIFVAFILLIDKEDSIHSNENPGAMQWNDLNSDMEAGSIEIAEQNSSNEVRQKLDAEKEPELSPITPSNEINSLDKNDQGANELMGASDVPIELQYENIPPYVSKKHVEASGLVPRFPNSNLNVEDGTELQDKLASYYKSIGYFTDEDRSLYADFDEALLYSMSIEGDLLANEVLIRQILKQSRFQEAQKLKIISRVFGNAAASPYTPARTTELDDTEHFLRARMGDYYILFLVATLKSQQRTPEQIQHADSSSLGLLHELNKLRSAKGLHPLPIKPDDEVIRYHTEIFIELNVEGYLRRYLNFEIDSN